ncbi:MAG: copper resistance protein B [Woeseia sp.]|nr:copper resistance protein B [Woeseia sp.]MBT8095641.1 copper resistance protein B [Woeseia sp.]NNE61523.1 copper resistance protein B [Woeseia sp.]NNL54119.1 copper resistance protein B [Woeseia sp.]
MKCTNALLIPLCLLATTTFAAKQAGTPDDWEMPMHKPGPFWMLLGDRLESGFADGTDRYAWDVQGWYGYDFNRLRFKTEGEGEHGRSPEDAEVQLLFSRLFAPFWEWQVGVRRDVATGSGRSHVVAGIQGQAPYRFEVDVAIFVSEDGDTSGRAEVEYDLRLTQRLVLQPRVELNVSWSDVSELGITRGFNSAEAGVRVRYEVQREFAPYFGITWQKRNRIAGDAGESSTASLLLGVRAWF